MSGYWEILSSYFEILSIKCAAAMERALYWINVAGVQENKISRRDLTSPKCCNLADERIWKKKPSRIGIALFIKKTPSLAVEAFCSQLFICFDTHFPQTKFDPIFRVKSGFGEVSSQPVPLTRGRV